MLEIIGSNLKPEGFIGIRMVDAPMRIVDDGKIENIRAVRILSVVPNTAASKAGLKPGDQITHLDGNKFPDQGLAYLELSKYIRAKSSGEQVKLHIRRGFGVSMKKMEIDDLRFKNWKFFKVILVGVNTSTTIITLSA